MPNIPAVCPECSSVFSMPIFIENSTIEISGITVTCPNCLRNVMPDDGKYEHQNDVLRVVDSENDDFINNIIAIYTSDINNHSKLNLIEKVFEDKRGKELIDVAGEDLREKSVEEKLMYILVIISSARNFKEDISFINDLIQFILSH